MAESSPQEWVEDFERTKLLTKELRASLQHGKAGDAKKKCERLQGSVEQLELNLGRMEGNAKRYGLKPKELNQRRAALNTLKGEMNFVLQMTNKQGRYKGSNLPSDVTGYSSEDVLAMQKSVLQAQDEELVEIERGVGNLKQYGMSIHDEANLHVRLLDEMDRDVDEASAGLRAEAERTRQASQTANTFKLKLTIVILTIILILLLLLGATK